MRILLVTGRKQHGSGSRVRGVNRLHEGGGRQEQPAPLSSFGVPLRALAQVSFAIIDRYDCASHPSPKFSLGPIASRVLVRLTVGFALLEGACQLPIESPDDRWPLGIIASQFFILRPLDRGDSLVLRYAACNRLLNGVADIHQHLSVTGELLSALLRVCGKRTM